MPSFLQGMRPLIEDRATIIIRQLRSLFAGSAKERKERE
jgi:hypothetical protein